jgi:hypothetical protein
MVVQEQTQTTEVVVTSVSVQQTFVQNDETIELQNRLNQNQEVTKTLSAKVCYINYCLFINPNLKVAKSQKT